MCVCFLSLSLSSFSSFFTYLSHRTCWSLSSDGLVWHDSVDVLKVSFVDDNDIGAASRDNASQKGWRVLEEKKGERKKERGK